MTADIKPELRKTGISIVGDVPWSTDFCHFYETKRDLLDILVPYFKTGLEEGEFCLWIVFNPLGEAEAEEALRNAVPHFDQHLAAGDIEIHPHADWYVKDGKLDFQNAAACVEEKLDWALASGYAGLRVSLNKAWLSAKDLKDFLDYEKRLTRMAPPQRVIFLCTYPLGKCRAEDLFDMARAHEFAIAKREGKWGVLETPELSQARTAIRRQNEELEQRVEESTRELESANSELKGEITERRRAEEELKQSEERLRLAADAAGFGIYSCDFASGAGYWSPEFKALLGVPPDQPLALDEDNLFVGLHPDDRAGFLAAMTAANDPHGSGFLLHDYRVIHPNGEVRWLHVRGHTTFAGEGAERRAARATGVVLDITERKKAEEALRRSETKLRTLYDSTSDAIMLMDVRGFFDCNPATLALYGCATREEFCSKHPADLSPPTQPDGTDSRKLADRQIATAMENGRNQFEWLHKRADTGEVFPTHVLLTAMELDGKRVLQAIVRNITKLKQAQETASKAQATLRTIFDSTADHIWSVDSQDFGLLTFNRAFRDYYLQERGKRLQVGQCLEELLPNADYVECWRGFFQRALDSGPFTTEYLMSSGKVTLLLTFNPLEHEGAVFGVSVFGKDITESKRLEQALRESEGDLAEAQRVARIGSWAFNARSNEVVWSDELYRIFGLVRSEFGGTHEAFAECIHAEDRQRVLQVGKQARADGKPFDIEYRIVTPRGEQKVIEELGRPILNEAGQTVGLIGTAQDITERREAETELRNSRQQLRSLSARLESLREEERMRVAREIHDELGQMLTGLKLDLQWMEEKLGELPPSAASGTLLDRVVRSTELVDSVVVAVQNIAADLRPGVLDGLGLGPAMQYEARRFQENSGIACGVRLPEAEPSLSAQQSTALFRILQASLTNVARHANARKVEVELRTEAGFVILTVQDNGRGITEADIARPESLGLLGMKERAGLLGGEMIFEGNRGVPGTVVTARIPHTPPPPPMGKPKNEGANC